MGAGRASATRHGSLAPRSSCDASWAVFCPNWGPGDGEAGLSPDYLMLFEGVSALLGHVANRQPTVLILEDLHWSDEMSSGCWRSSAAASRRGGSLLAGHGARGGTGRRADASADARASWSASPTWPRWRWGHCPGAIRPDLVRLSRAGGSGRRRGGSPVRAGVAHQRGNPLVVVEATRAAAHETLSPGLDKLALPKRVRDIIGRQLDRLDEPSRELVALASVTGARPTSLSCTKRPGLGRRRPRGASRR